MTHKVTANVTTEAAFKPPLFYGLALFSFLQLLAWLLPNHYFPWLTFYQEFLSATALLSVAFALFITNKHIQIPWVSILVVTISLIPLIQWQTNIIPFVGDAVMSSFFVFGLAAAITVGYNLRQTQYDIFNTLAFQFIIGGLISTFMAIYQWLELSGMGIYIADIQTNSRPYANLAQPNMLATLIMCSLISLAYLWESERISSNLAAFLTPLLVLGLALPQSRTTWAITIVLGSWWLLKNNKLKLKLNLTHLLAVIGLYISFIYLKPIFEDILLIANDSRLLSTDIGVRGDAWKLLLDAVLKGPAWGFGWQPVSAAQISVALDHPVTGIFFQQSHNLILELLIWNGLWLGACLILSSVWWFTSRMIKINSQSSWFAFAIILAMITHAMLEFPLHYAFFLLPFGLLVGYVEAASENKIIFIYNAPRPVMIGLTLFGAIFLTLITREYIIIEKDFRLLRFETKNIGNLRAEQPAPDVIILDQLREFNRLARTEATPNMSPEDLKQMETVVHRNPAPAALMRYALALGLNGRYQEVSIELQRLRKLHGEELYEEAKNNWATLTKKYPEFEAVSIP